MSDFLAADQAAERARAEKYAADLAALSAMDPLAAAADAAARKKAEQEARKDQVLSATASIMAQFDPAQTPDAEHNLATFQKDPLFEGAPDWQYIDSTTAAKFRAAIAESENPEETELRLQTGYFLSKLHGIPLDEALRDQDAITAAWRQEALSPRGAWEAVGNTWKAAFIGTEIAKLSYLLWMKGYGGGSGSVGAGETAAAARSASWGNLEADPLYQQILELEKQLPPPDVLKRSLPTKALQAFGQFMPSMLESARAGAAGGAAGAVGAAGLAVAAGIADAASLGTLTVPMIALLGFKVGSAAGAGTKSRELETGAAFYDMLRYQDPQTGARINPDAALLWSGAYGGLAAAVESLQMGTFFKALPGMGAAAQKALTKAASEALEDRGAQAARAGVFQRALARWAGARASDLGQRAGDIAAETSQEVLQQAIQLGAQEFARQVTERLDGTEIQPASYAEIRDALVETAAGAALGFATANVLPASMKMFTQGAQEARVASRTAAALGAEEPVPALKTAATPEAVSVFAKRAAEPLPEGTYIQPREEIEGEQYVLKAGNRETGERLGSLRYEVDAEARAVTVLGLEKGRDPNVNAFLLRGLGARFPGWDIQFEAKTENQAALKQFLIDQNPRGPEAGLQHFEAPRETPDRISMDYVRSRIREVAPSWEAEAVDVAANVLPMWSRRLGMTAEELANAALDPQIFGRILDKRGVAAQAATGAFKPVRGDEGWFKGIIDMSAKANPSTALHEMTHAVVNFARQARNTPQVAQFLAELEGALGVVDGNWEAEFSGWTEEYQGRNRTFLEAITYGLEDYFSTGKAPKPELEGLFRKLAQWVLDIYEGLKGARVKLSPALTSYFDDLVAGEGSPFLEARQSVNETELGAEEKTLNSVQIGQGQQLPVAAGAEDLELFQGQRRREISGARRDLAEARRLAAEGRPAAEIRAATGWSEQGGEWRLDKGFATKPAFDTARAEERERQTPRATGEAALGPATLQPKGYPEEGPLEDAPEIGSEVLLQGDWGRKLPVEEGMAAQGIAALLEAKEGHVEHAVYRDEVGWIDIPWGVAGDLDRDYAGGWGLSHIKAKHEYTDEVIGKIPLILRTGRVLQDPKFRNRRWIVLGKYQAVVQLTREGQTQPWLVTAYIPEKLRKSAPAGSGQQTDSAPKGAPPPPDVAGRSPPANGRRAIVRRKPGPGNTLDRNNIAPEEPLYQGDALAASQTLLFQKDELDEAGLANLKEIARSFTSWQELSGYLETFEAESRAIPQDMGALEKQAWYRWLWEEARKVEPISLEDWTRRLEADAHAGLYDFLEAVWTEILLPAASRIRSQEDMEFADQAASMKGELAETIVAAAQRVGQGRRDLDSRFIASLMGTIRKNPEEYARIYGQVMGQPEVAELGRQAEKEKYADIKDPKLRDSRLSISERAALAAQIRDEKLAKEVLSGKVQMDEKAKAYLETLKAEQRAARKRIADLSAEVKVDETVLSEQDRRLVAARAESDRTTQEIRKTKKRLERFLSLGQKVPAGYDAKLRSQEERAKSLRKQLARIGDYQFLEAEKRDLEARLSHAERFIQENRARGEESPPGLIARRSNLAEQIRKLEPRLKAAAEAWKDNAGLQTHLAKVEALAKAKEEFQVREAEKRAVARLRKYQDGLVRQIIRPVGDRTYVQQASAIQKIQALIDPVRRKESTQADIDLLRAELEKNPDLAREVPREWLKRAAGKNLNEMTLQELEETARQVQNLRELGRQLFAIQEKERREWKEAYQARIVDILRASPGFVEPKGYETEKSFADRFKDRVRTMDYAFLNMRRIANKLDGGKDGANVEILWHEMNRAYRREMVGIDRRTAKIMSAFVEAGVDPTEWYGTTVIVKGAGPGRSDKILRKSDLLALELAFRNEDSRAAALFGNFFSQTEKKTMDEEELFFEGAARFDALRAAIDSVLTEKDQKVLEVFAADAKEAGARLSGVVAKVQNKVLEMVGDYFPIRRQGVTQEPVDVQIAGDMLDRTGGLRRPPRNGFTKQRIKISPAHQSAIKLDLLSTWLESIKAQEHYIATAEWGKKLDDIYTDSYMQEQIKAVLGDPGVKYVKEYIAEAKNPGELAHQNDWESAIRYLRGNLGAAYLAFRASSALKQVITSPWPTLPYAGPRMLSETMRCLANPMKFLRETEEMSVFLKHRSRDMVAKAIDEAEAATPAAKALLGANKLGMKGIELADRFSCAIGWRACFEKALVEFKGDEAKAIEKADDAIMTSQPSARGVDLAPIYRGKSEGTKLLLQFTQAINVIWQNLRYDLPNAVKNHQFGTAVGIAVSYMIAGVLLNAVTSRPPEGETDEEKARRIMFWTITQATDSIPLLGQDATRFARGLITGDKESVFPRTALPGAGEIMDGLGKITQGDWEKGLTEFALGSGMILGMPTSGIKEAGRVLSGDLGALAGRPAKKD